MIDFLARQLVEALLENDSLITCPTCKGALKVAGRSSSWQCPRCHGTGKIPAETLRNGELNSTQNPLQTQAAQPSTYLGVHGDGPSV